MIHYITTNGIGNAWVANELCQVGGVDIPFVLHSMRQEAGYHLSDWAVSIHHTTNVIYPIPVLSLVGALVAAPARFGRRFPAALANAFFGARESLRARFAGILHFAVACWWAAQLRPENVTHIHSQWIHSCGTIGMYGAWLLGKSFSFTGHAADLFRERCALRDKIRRAEFIVCISTFHRDFFLKEGARPEQLKIVYCGIDVDHFSPRTSSRTEDGIIHIRSSGRLVEKKGFGVLIDACRILADRDIAFDCVIGGSGPLELPLRRQVDRLSLVGRVRITGQSLKQENIPDFMAGADVFCLPCVWASDGGVDGLPQMLMEAMACGVPVISTRLVGIPDLVIEDETGLLVEPNDPAATADAIVRIARDRALTEMLSGNGRRYIQEKFNLATCLTPLIDEYRRRLKPGTGAAEERVLFHLVRSEE